MDIDIVNVVWVPMYVVFVLITLLLFVAADVAAAAVKQSIPGNQIRKVK